MSKSATQLLYGPVLVCYDNETIFSVWENDGNCSINGNGKNETFMRNIYSAGKLTKMLITETKNYTKTVDCYTEITEGEVKPLLPNH